MNTSAAHNEIACKMDDTDEKREEKPHYTSPVHQTESTDDGTEESFCPLFMDGLPTDFKNNPALAAIASLLEDDDDNDDAVKKNSHQEEDDTGNECTMSGGGKAVRKKKLSNRSKPYSNVKKKTKTSVGETQLFLKMWKI